jgi:hypothetical protein
LVSKIANIDSCFSLPAQAPAKKVDRGGVIQPDKHQGRSDRQAETTNHQEVQPAFTQGRGESRPVGVGS